MAFHRPGAPDQAEKVERKKNFLKIMQEARRNGVNHQVGEEKLTIKQQMFVEHYCLNGNTTQAYIDTFSTNDKDFTREKAAFNGCQLLKKPNVKAAIENRRKALRQTFQVEEERIILELARLAFSKMTDYYYLDDNGSIAWRNPDELTDDQQAAIQDISIFENVVTNTRRIAKMKLYNKQAALTELCKILGLFDEYARKKAPQVSINIEEVLAAMPPGIGDAVRERMVYDLNENSMELQTIN